MSNGAYADTGTWPNRRRLTLAEAEAGLLPARMTPDEWRMMRNASRRIDTFVRHEKQLDRPLVRS